MKTLIGSKTMASLAVMLLCGPTAQVLMAQPLMEAQNPAPAVAQPASQTAPMQLSSGVWEVLKLVHAKVSDAIVTAYIKNSGTTFPLGASEILYLREQGVSDPVLTAMLEKRKDAAQPVAQPAAAPAASVWTSDSSPQPAPAPAPPAPAQAAPTYVAAAPVYTQPAPVYVYSPPTYIYSNPAPYYGPSWGFPALAFSFAWGSGGHHGGYHGGGHH